MEVKGDLLEHVSSISCNNDQELGKIIAEAYRKVGKDGVVLMEESPTGETYMDIVDGVQIDSPLKSQYLTTNEDKTKFTAMSYNEKSSTETCKKTNTKKT